MTFTLVAFFVAAALAALRQYLRLRDRRQIPLLLMFALLALAHSRDAQSPWSAWWHLAAGLAGLAQLLALSPRHPPSSPHRTAPPPAAS